MKSKDFERKLRRAKELNSTDFGEDLLRDPGPRFRTDLRPDPYEVRSAVGGTFPGDPIRSLKKKVLSFAILILYLITALIVGTIGIFGYLFDLLCR